MIGYWLNGLCSVSLYEEAQRLFATITFSDKSASTSKRVRHHAQSLELTAVASVAFACIKLAEVCASDIIPVAITNVHVSVTQHKHLNHSYKHLDF